MADWFRRTFTKPADDVRNRVIQKFEDVGGTVVKAAYAFGVKVAREFEAAGSNALHKAVDTAHQVTLTLDKDVHRGLQKVEGAASTLLHKAENAGSNIINDLENATAKTARTVNNGLIHPFVHAIGQPIENAWLGSQMFIASLTRPLRIVFYGGLLIGGYWLYTSLEDRREESRAKRRRYR